MHSRPRKRWTLLAIVGFASVACQPRSFGGGGVRNHPNALVGQWVDSAKSSPTDTSLWILDAAGNDNSQHVRLESDSSGTSTSPARFVVARARHYGYWFLRGELADRSDRRICFTNRPGRSAPTCEAFDLDSFPVAAGVRRRLVVRGYQGAHNTSNRVLLARIP